MDTAQSFIAFEVAGTTYAIRSQSVQQLEMIDNITPLPNAPPFVDGVVFSRGKVIPAMNLRARFGFERTSTTVRSRLVIVSSEKRMVGLIVDSAREFISISEDAIRPPHESMSGISGDYLDGIATIGDRIVLVLRVEALISLEDICPTTAGA